MANRNPNDDLAPVMEQVEYGVEMPLAGQLRFVPHDELPLHVNKTVEDPVDSVLNQFWNLIYDQIIADRRNPDGW